MTERVATQKQPGHFRRVTGASGQTARIPVTLTVIATLSVTAIAFGLFLRLWMLAHASTNSDGAIVGLMADAILNWHFSAFYWGQAYGGGEPYVVAVLFALFGHSAYVLNITPVILAAIAGVVTWRIGYRVFGRHDLAVLAASITWIWSENTVWGSTREMGFRGVTLVCGLAALLVAFRIADDNKGRWRDWVLLGLLSGLGSWSSPEIVYFLVPVVILVVLAALRETSPTPVLRGLVVSAGFFVLGALPWLVNNVNNGFLSLSTNAGTHGTYISRIDIFFSKVLPILLGLRAEGAGEWIISTGFGTVVYGLLLLAIVGAAVLFWARFGLGKVLVVFVFAFPLLYALFPPTSFWNDGRYGVYLPPILVLVLVGGAATLAHPVRPSQRIERQRRLLRGAGMCLAAICVTSIVAGDLYIVHETFPTGVKLAALGLRPTGNATATSVIGVLERTGVNDFVAGYWVAYDLDFLSHERLHVTPLDTVRVPALYAQVMGSKTIGWVFVRPGNQELIQAAGQFGSIQLNPGGTTEAALSSRLLQAKIRFRIVSAGPLEVVITTGVPGAQICLNLGACSS